MRRLRNTAFWVLGILLALPVVAIGAVLIVANTGSGRRLIAREAPRLSGGLVTLSGLGGRFPDALRLGHLEVRDRAGAWLSADDVVLDWSPLALLGGTARVARFTVGHLAVPRLPLPASGQEPQPGGSGFSLPVSVDVGHLAIDRADIGAPVAGTAASLRVTGTAHVLSLQQGSATVDATRLDSAGAYHVQAALMPDAVNADVTARERQGGLIASLARLPALGALDVTARVHGPKAAEQAAVTASAGPLRLDAAGTIDIPGKKLAVDLKAAAPSMRPRADIAWQGIDISAHVAGPFLAPDAVAHVGVDGLQAGGAAVQRIVADVTGSRGSIDLKGQLTGTRLPGAQAALFAGAPIDVAAQANLQAVGRPVSFSVAHPLLTLQGQAQTSGGIAADVSLSVPDVAPLAASAGQDVRGKLDMHAHAAQHGGAMDVTADGRADITGGRAPLPALLGATTFKADAILAGQDVTVKALALDARAAQLSLAGAKRGQALDFTWILRLPDLEAAAPQARGAIDGKGHIGGTVGSIDATAEITGDAGSAQFAKAPIAISLRANHVPAAPDANIDAKLQFFGAPLRVLAQAQTAADGTLHTVLQQADWKSFAATADLSLRKGADVPVGKATVSVGRLADFAQLAGTDLSGSLKAVLASAPDNATVDVQGRNLASGPRSIASLSLTGRAAGAINDPDLNAVLSLNGIAAQGMTGQSRITLRGKQTALTIGATAQLQNVHGAPANLSLAALLNAKAKKVRLTELRGDWKTLGLREQGQAVVDFGAKIAVDRLRMNVNQASLDIAGRVSPTLDLTAALRNVTPELAKPLAPALAAAGVLSADARLTGTTAAPQGHVRVSANGLRMKTGPAASLPAATVAVTADLNGRSARIDARVNAGPKLAVSAHGTAPLAASGALDVTTTGNFDLSLLAPILEAGGRRASGRASLDVTAAGTPLAPRLAGSVTLSNAEIQDYVQGLHLTNIAARLDANGDTLTVTRFHATAGPGNIEVAGSVGVAAPGLPVDLHITAHNARPLASDLLTARFDADLRVQGHAEGDMQAGGTVRLQRVDINVPDSLPPSVAVLNVRKPGQKPPPADAQAAPPPAVVRLHIVVDAPSNIFVRGKGLDAELGGRLTVGGTSAAPQVEGGFDMRRGDFSLAGTTLTFTKGSVGFNGANSLGKIDPTLNFEADSTQNGVTATLKVTGYADAPKIALSSVPDLPQDEVVAHLLFGAAMKDLTPFQIAEIAAALAELSGATGSGGPLASLRKGLGLDRLSVGGGNNGAGTTVEAGKYVAKGVYVGAKQSAGGAGGTQALVQIDLTRHLKLNTTLGTGGGTAQGATPQNDPGSSVGLSYQFDY